jgi:hypothetical protein
VGATPSKLRSDPKKRAFDGDQDDLIALVNQEPGVHYCWVSQAGSLTTGVARYRARGYEVVQYRKGGVCPAGMETLLKEGQPIEHLDTVLMACPDEVFLAQEKRGQDLADVRERKMIDRKHGPRDPMRGLYGATGRALEQSISVSDSEEESLFGG